MKYVFDETLDHKTNLSYRWAQPEGRNDVIGMGTADMDFYCPPCVREATETVHEENTFNYRQKPDNYFQTIIDWYDRMYGLNIQREWLSNVPTTLGAIRIAIEAFSKKGDAVLMQSPYFAPLKSTIEGAGCHLITNPMVLTDGRFELDFEDFEEKLKQERPSLFLMTNPHNPTGRSFSADELLRLVELCDQYGVKIISDEVHSLILHDGRKHTPVLAVSEKAQKISIQVLAMCKGFNMMSLPHTIITIANPEMRSIWENAVFSYWFHYASNSYTIAAVTSVLSGAADEWLKEVTAYLQHNRDLFIRTVLEKGLPLKPLKPEAGFLMWIDCRDSGLDIDHLDEVFLDRAGISIQDGAEFGETGKGFVRMNFAVTEKVLCEALERMEGMFEK